MEQQSQWVGIDASKAHLDVYLRPSAQQFQVKNQASGIIEFIEQLQSFEIQQVILEATGGFELEVAQALQAQGLPLLSSILDKHATLPKPVASWSKQTELMQLRWLTLGKPCNLLSLF